MKKLVTGRAAFVDDVTRAGILHLGLVASPHAHARILEIDAAAARALPGVVDVMTHADLAWRAPEEGPARPAGAVLAPVVAFIGAPAAIVVAEDPEIAARAVDAVRVSYEPLAAVHWTAPAPPGGGLEQVSLASGDSEGAFAEADRTFEVTHHLSRTRVAPLEPPVALSWLDEDGRLVVRSATASPLRLRRLLSDALGLAGGRIRVERPEVGGDFGTRDGVFLESACALVALRTGRPARLALRPDHPAGGFERAACEVTARAAIQGRALTAIHVRLLQEAGTSLLDGGLEAELRRAAATLASYDLRAARFEARLSATNTPPAGGSAALATAVAVEAVVDEAAEALGEDPLAFRKRHVGVLAHEAGLASCLERCAREAAFGRRLVAARGSASRRGLGVALCRSTLPGADATATVSRNEDASYTVAWSPCLASTSASDALEGLLALALGVPAESVTANLAAPAEPPAAGVADLWLTAQAVVAAGTEMASMGATCGAVTVSRRVDDAPAPAGAFVAEVDVELRTGVVTLLRLVQALGTGSSDPLVEAKAEGDALRGAGVVLFGQVPGAGYARPRTLDLPRLLNLLGSEGRESPFGTAPIGDVAFPGAAAAVANAVARAIGARVLELPLRPETVLAALEKARS
jgi:CO/xanthine dehydrogenase Mo-binding subunit